MIEVDRLPQLREPVLVAAFSGWVDAGLAGSGAAAMLAEQLTARSRFARLDLAELVDLSATRPKVRLVDDQREITWPGIELVAGSLGVDVVVATGPEPSIRWGAVIEELVELTRRLGVQRAYFLGGMPAAASHRRAVRVAATATRRSLAQELELLRDDYEGATGFQTAFQVALGDGGIDAVGLWAQVPGYLAGSPSPPAIAATLRRVGELARIDVRLAALDSQVDDYLRRVEAGLEERPDVADAVRAIEAGTTHDVPSGDELAREIERFLREQ